MPRRETPGHRGLSSRENDREVNGKEWAPNEAKLVDLRVSVEGNGEIPEEKWTGMRSRRRVAVKMFLAWKLRRLPFFYHYCDNIFLGAYENSIRSFRFWGFVLWSRFPCRVSRAFLDSFIGGLTVTMTWPSWALIILPFLSCFDRASKYAAPLLR